MPILEIACSLKALSNFPPPPTANAAANSGAEVDATAMVPRVKVPTAKPRSNGEQLRRKG